MFIFFLVATGGIFSHRQREGFQQCVGRHGDSNRRRRPRMFPRGTTRRRPAGEEQNPDSGYKHLWTESLLDNYQAGTRFKCKDPGGVDGSTSSFNGWKRILTFLILMDYFNSEPPSPNNHSSQWMFSTRPEAAQRWRGSPKVFQY